LTEEILDDSSKLITVIKKKMIERGKAMVGYSKIGDSRPFWRFICANPDNTMADMDFILQEFHECAKECGFEE
jgi:hypothetical protein